MRFAYLPFASRTLYNLSDKLCILLTNEKLGKSNLKIL